MEVAEMRSNWNKVIFDKHVPEDKHHFATMTKILMVS
jgi:hypothetical protein